MKRDSQVLLVGILKLSQGRHALIRTSCTHQGCHALFKLGCIETVTTLCGYNVSCNCFIHNSQNRFCQLPLVVLSKDSHFNCWGGGGGGGYVGSESGITPRVAFQQINLRFTDDYIHRKLMSPCYTQLNEYLC